VTKLYDRLFWTLLVTSAIFACAGCETFHAAVQAATTPNPQTGTTPLEDVLTGTGAVVLNPLSWPGWVQIASGIGVIVAGGYAAYKKASTKPE